MYLQNGPKMKKTYFWELISGKTNEEVFQKVRKLICPKIFLSQLAHFYSTLLYKKSGKTNEQIFHGLMKQTKVDL